MVEPIRTRLTRGLKSGDALAILFLGLWHWVFFYPITLGRKVFFGFDLLYLLYPIRAELTRAYAEGRLPLWSPGFQAGYPLFAEGEVAALYPLNLILHRIFPAHWALSYSILLHLSWAAVGMYVLMRAWRLRPASALLAGFVFGSGGFAVAHIQHVALFAVAAWLPWIVLFQTQCLRALTAGKTSAAIWFWLMTVALGVQFLGGSPQIALLNAGAVFVFGIAFVLIQARAKRDALPKVRRTSLLFRNALASALAILLGAGLAAPQLLATAELIGFSVRGRGVSPEFFSSYSLEPRGVGQFLFPFASVGEPGQANLEAWAYLGGMPFALVLLALILRREVRTWFLALFALVSLSLALGKFNPLYDLLYSVPLFNLFRVPARFLFPFTFAASALAAIGFDAIVGSLRDSPRRASALILLAIFGVALYWVSDQMYALPRYLLARWWGETPWPFIGASAGLLLAARARIVSRQVFATLGIGLVVLDLAAFAAPSVSGADVSLFYLAGVAEPSEYASIPRSVKAMGGSDSLYRVLPDTSQSVFSSYARAKLQANLPLAFGMHGVDAYISLALARTEEYVAAMSPAMLNLMNVRYYLTSLSAGEEEPAPIPAGEPARGLSEQVLAQGIQFDPLRVARVEIVSSTNRTGDLTNGTRVGEIVLNTTEGKSLTLPIQLGKHTADWAYDGLSQIGAVKHSRAPASATFLAYLSRVGREFQGRKYLARYDLAPALLSSVSARSYLPDAQLMIEQITLFDEQGRATELAIASGRNDFALVFRSHLTAMWENRNVLPRAFVVHRAEQLADDQILARLTRPDFQPGRIVLLSANAPTIQSEEKGDQVRVTEYRPERVTIETRAGSPGYLILADTWYPGWAATVDGKATPIYRADYIFRAVSLETGAHQVVFEYHPTWLAPGLMLAGASIALTVVITHASLRAKRSNLLAANWGLLRRKDHASQ